MVSFLSSWASGVVVSVIVGSIIEMILPEGNNKKYVKTVIGVFILFTIISPVIVQFAGGIDLKSLINFEEYMDSVPVASGNIINNNDIVNVYKANISKEIKSTLEQNGYMISTIDIKVNETQEKYGEIEEVSLMLKEDNSKIEKINIDINGVEKTTEVSDKIKYQIKELINSNYGVSKEKIHIN